jgi:hypothetical protein
MAGLGGEDGHELFKWSERVSFLENRFFFDLEIREEWSIVERIEP